MPCMKERNVGRAYLADEFIIPANSQAVVFAEFTSFKSKGRYVFLEPVLKRLDVLVAKSIHDWSSKRQCCTLINLTTKDVKLSKGTCLGSLFSGEITSEDGEVKLGEHGGPGCVEVPLAEKINAIEKLNMGSNLSSTERSELVDLLLAHYDEFQWDSDTIGRTHLVEHTIETGDARPIVQRQYPIPTVAKEAMREQVKDMRKKGFIRESYSAWRSPVLLIKKVGENGEVTYRFCIDLRKVNDETVKDRYLLPRIDETVDALSGSKFFSTMDVDRAFWQVGLKEEHKCKTAFAVDGQLWEFNVMPFGASNAPATFQRLMDRVLRGLTWHQCIVYIDDVLVFAKSFSAHLANLDLVLTRIRDAGLKLKPSKCKFADNRVDYLGFSISDKGRQPSRRKVEALLKVEPPNTNKALMSFLLSLNYYRTDIPRFGELTVDLYEMANSKKRLCVWTERLRSNFKELQQALGLAPILAFPVFELPFIIQGDSSKKAIGGANLQGDSPIFDEITKISPVSFFGRKLTPTEQRWDVMCRELLALIYGYESSLHIVYGRHIIFLTDHEPLVTLKNLKNPLGRVGRLLHRLQGVDYEIRYIKGEKNHLADFMSRVEHPGDPIPSEVSSIEINSGIDWAAEQRRDETLVTVRKLVESQICDENTWRALKDGSAWWKIRDELFIAQDILRINSGQVVVPEVLVPNVLEWHHNSAVAGHRGAETVLSAVKFRYYWNFMVSRVTEHCRSCEKCQKFNYSNMTSKAPMGTIGAQRRNELLELDFMGPFRTSRNGNSYIVLAVDVFTKYLEGVATVSFDALISAIFIFNMIFCRHGPYEKILTDRGRNFESHLFLHICRLVGAKKLRTTAFHAQCNGGIERVNKVIKPCLAKLLDVDQDDWDLFLPMAISAYNNSYHSSIGMTPFEAHFGRPSVMIPDLVMNNPLPKETSYKNVSEYTLGLWENAQRIQDTIRENLKKARGKQKAAYDKNVNVSRQYEIGDKVKLINYAKVIGKSSGFIDKFLGPFTISEIRGLTYIIADGSGQEQTVHYNRMLPYYENHSKLCAYGDNPETPIFHSGVSKESVLSEDSAYGYSGEVFGLRRSSRIFVALKARERMRLSAMLIDGSQATSGRVDVNQIREIGSDDDTTSEYEDTVSNGVLELTDPIGFEEEQDMTVRNELNQTHRVIDEVDKVKVTLDKLMDGSPNSKSKATKMCPGCKRSFEARYGIGKHVKSCAVFLSSFEVDSGAHGSSHESNPTREGINSTQGGV